MQFLHRELMGEALGRRRNAPAIWQDLVDDDGLAAGYASVRHFVRQVRGAATPDARVVIVTVPTRKARSITATARWYGRPRHQGCVRQGFSPRGGWPNATRAWSSCDSRS